jgi:hypothetical protein
MISAKKRHDFKPTPAMQLFARQRAKEGDDLSIAKIARKIGVTRETASRWQKLPKFAEWLDEQVWVYRSPILELIEAVAINRLDDFRYWEAVAKKYGYIQAEQVHAEPSKTEPQYPAMTKEQAEALLKEKLEKWN